jgi:poly-gamma-glutamate synthesis protein (capsule biosynthesis protein)
VGDILLAGRAERLIADKGAAAPFAGVSGVLREADLAVGNVECSLSKRGTAAEKKFTFRADPKTVAALTDAGFDVVTLANNHAVDYGPTALSDTIAAMKSAGIAVVGAGDDAASARQPVIIKAGDPPLSIAFLAFSNMRPTDFYARRNRPGTNPAYPDAIKKAVSAAKRHADVVIALFHWGDELSESPSASQRYLAYLAADAGADLVVGHHPHVLQGFQRRGHALIAYSLGNFLFPSRGERRTTIILRYTPQRDGRARVEAVPCVIDGFQPRPADQKQRAACLRHLRKLSAALGDELLDGDGSLTLSPSRAP